MNDRTERCRAGLTRRKFLVNSAKAAAGLSVAGSATNAQGTGTVSSNKRRICIFSKHLQWLDYDAMADTAAETGFDGVDLTVRPGGHVVPEKVEEDLPRAVEAVRKAGLDVDMMATAIMSAEDPLTEPVLSTASKLGIKYYRMGRLRYKDSLGVAECLESYKPQLHDLAQLNKHHRIHGAYQNHCGTNVGSPVWDLWLLLKDLDPAWIGCQYDVRHATAEGGYSWPLGLSLLSRYIKITAIKDFKWAQRGDGWRAKNCPLGEGMVDFEKYFGIVKKEKINGPISLHIEYPIVPEKEKLSEKERRSRTMLVMRKDLQKLREMLGAAGLCES